MLLEEQPGYKFPGLLLTPWPVTCLANTVNPGAGFPGLISLLGLCNKVPHSEWLKQQKLILSQLWRLDV